MIQECRDGDKLRVACETLGFLTLDKSNRKIAHELQAPAALLALMRCPSMDQQTLIKALDALCTLCRHDVKDKVRGANTRTRRRRCRPCPERAWRRPTACMCVFRPAAPCHTQHAHTHAHARTHACT